MQLSVSNGCSRVLRRPNEGQRNLCEILAISSLGCVPFTSSSFNDGKLLVDASPLEEGVKLVRGRCYTLESTLTSPREKATPRV